MEVVKYHKQKLKIFEQKLLGLFFFATFGTNKIILFSSFKSVVMLHAQKMLFNKEKNQRNIVNEE